MSQTTCPNGHVSADPEWCDTCGARLGPATDAGAADAGAAPSADAGAAPAGTPPAAGVAGLDSIPCPHCAAANESDALFCEQCGYDFTTGQAPEPPPTATVPAVSGPVSPARSAPVDGGGADPAQPGAASAAPTGWIVIVEVDPTWFALKGTLADRPCPSPSSSTIPLGQPVVHIGRSSQSRGIHPEVALDSDTAVSRRHAQLIATVTAGAVAPVDDPAGAGGALPDAYAVIDLGSTNGTFVVSADSEPTESIEPIAPGVATMLTDGDRVYIGAWSRLTLRHTGA